MARLRDITGQRFGRLTPKSWRRDGRSTIWLCSCDCGTDVEVVLGQLTTGKTKSCGCLKADRNRMRCKTHGMSRSPEYLSFRNALYRCTRQEDPRYYAYGARGIEFRFTSFDQFIAAIGPRPSSQHSLDRIDNDGHYEPQNVRWATRQQQRSNRRDRVAK